MIALYIALGVVAFVVFCTVFFWYHNNVLSVSRYQVTCQNARTPVTMLVLSDLHGKSFGRGQRRLLRKIDALSPQVICFVGDSVHRYSPRNIAAATQLFASLTPRYPVLFVTGNHERLQGCQSYCQTLKSLGVTVLDDSAVTVQGLRIYGISDAQLRNGAVMPCQNADVLMAHEPQLFPEYVKAGYPVVLCGHAHGGQWRIPYFNIGLYSSRQGVFPRYYQGVHTQNGTQMVITRGLGNTYFPLRLFNRPELVLLTVSA